jgi:hypothetical protein
MTRWSSILARLLCIIASAAVAGSLSHVVAYTRLHETGDTPQEVRIADGEVVCRPLITPVKKAPVATTLPSTKVVSSEGKLEEKPSVATVSEDDSKRSTMAPSNVASAGPTSVDVASLSSSHVTMYGQGLDRGATTSMIYQCLHPIRARKDPTKLSKEDLATVRRTYVIDPSIYLVFVRPHLRLFLLHIYSHASSPPLPSGWYFTGREYVDSENRKHMDRPGKSSRSSPSALNSQRMRLLAR